MILLSLKATLLLDIFAIFVIIDVFLLYLQVMQTENQIYLVTEYASGGEIFGEVFYVVV